MLTWVLLLILYVFVIVRMVVGNGVVGVVLLVIGYFLRNVLLSVGSAIRISRLCF